MEKYARQALSEGITNHEDIHVGAESEIYRVLNLHYNRNNHIEVRMNFISPPGSDLLCLCQTNLTYAFFLLFPLSLLKLNGRLSSAFLSCRV